jgi:type VI secretion system protein ImpM
MVLFWTGGSHVVQPSCLVTKGLPEPEQFVALLDGAWDERRWNAVSAHLEVPSVTEETLAADPMPPRFRSAARTDRGAVRQVNQDSLLERSEIGLWVVADGVGGHQDGDVASRMICDALADFLPGAGFEEMIEGTRQRLHEVNDYLVQTSARAVNPVVCGSTVVALMARGSRCAAMWAGDSRVYRWRAGEMEQLTRDHSVAALDGGDSHAITRAIGGEATLALDLFRDRVHPGDRFLLCSDGLVRVLWESEIAEWMAAEDIETAVNGLIEATLAGGAPDNVTVLVVEAYLEPLPSGASSV